MSRRKEPAIPAELLDQLLAGGDAAAALDQGGLLDALKKALAERALNAEMDQHLGGDEQAGNSRNGYVRVSTKRQAEHQVSLVEQEKRIRAYCAQQGLELIKVYIEPGASARGDRRRVFQQMIADATSEPKPFDIVLTYNFSRFFRNDFQFEAYRRQLEEVGIDYQSITQQVGQGPAGKLTRGVATLVDAYTSDLNAEATKAAMLGNADAGYWNGSTPPFGYRTYIADRHSNHWKISVSLVR
jgi:DNA invertase Pin-like site-specific DNA recombinase